MKFTLDNPDDTYNFGSYGNGELVVNRRTHTSSLIIFPDWLQEHWPVKDPSQLLLEHLAVFIERRPDIAILGTGATQIFPPLALRRQLAHERIQLEVMDSGAACRTYNLLASEGRDVGAAVICF